MKTRSFAIFIIAWFLVMGTSAQAQRGSGLKGADELLKVWDNPLTRTTRVTVRKTTAPVILMQNYQRIAAASLTRSGKDHHRGINVVPMNQEQVQVSVQVEPDSGISFDNILFVLGAAEFLNDASRQQVAIIAEAMKKKAEISILIEGHTCDLGEKDQNKTLSEQRAAKVVTELKQLGISPERLLPLGYGEEEAQQDGGVTEEIRQKERRVTIHRRV